MTAAAFDFLLERRLSLTKRLLASKATEYATDADRLHNFKTAAVEFGGTPEEACKGYMLKHWMSVRDLIVGERPVTRELLDDKIGDVVNYMILLEALLIERAGL
jgi:hypothetical protein